MSQFDIIVWNVLQATITGLSVGFLYGLMCLGLGLIFGIMRVINFAHGDVMMLGMYAAWYLFTGFGVLLFLGPHAGPIVAAIMAGPIVFVFGYFLHRLLISRVSGFNAIAMEGEGHYAQLILTLGVALVLHNGGLILFGSSPLTVRTPLTVSAWQIPLWGDITLFVNKARLISGILSAAIALLTFLFIFRSMMGKSLRAAADNPVAALYMGIDVDRGHRIAFGVGAGITAIAGGLLATYYPFQPYVGFEYIIIMYTGVVLGGLGSVAGAFWGGVVIGLIQQLSTLILPNQLQNTAVFVVFLLIIFFRPQGLFGKSVDRV